MEQAPSTPQKLNAPFWKSILLGNRLYSNKLLRPLKRFCLRFYERYRFHRFNLALRVMKTRNAQKIRKINFWERKIHSQYGEDGIIEIIFYLIGTSTKYFVEIGVEDGKECNTRHLQEHRGWTGIMMDGVYENPPIKTEFVTAENVNDLLAKYNVPKELDLLSIDIDGNDYWVWKAIEGFSPRMVVIEYNSVHPPTESKVIKYDPEHRWDQTNYFGASLLALVKLGRSKGYTLVGCENKGVNAFFVRDNLIEGHFEPKSVAELYKPPKYGKRVGGVHVGHRPSDREMITI